MPPESVSGTAGALPGVLAEKGRGREAQAHDRVAALPPLRSRDDRRQKPRGAAECAGLRQHVLGATTG